MPKLLLPAYQLQCASDASRLFVGSERGSVHVLQLLEPGGCKHLHTLRPPTGGQRAPGGAGGVGGAGLGLSTLPTPGFVRPCPGWALGGADGEG